MPAALFLMPLCVASMYLLLSYTEPESFGKIIFINGFFLCLYIIFNNILFGSYLYVSADTYDHAYSRFVFFERLWSALFLIFILFMGAAVLIEPQADYDFPILFGALLLISMLGVLFSPLLSHLMYHRLSAPFGVHGTRYHRRLARLWPFGESPCGINDLPATAAPR